MANTMKTLLLSLTCCILGGCSSMDHFVCYGAGACNRDGTFTAGTYSTPTATASNFNQGGVIVTSSGNYVVVPKATGGAYPAAIIRSGR